MTTPAGETAVDLATTPVEIAPNVWWVGKRPGGQIFYANPYLRVFPGKEGSETDSSFHLIIDPGSRQDFPVVRSKCEQVIGSVERIGAIFINHQDPDVGSAVGLMMERFTPGAQVICSEDTWRLIQYYNVPRDRFVAIEGFPRGMAAPNGETIVPVPSPFCHFVGAVMLYDRANRVLFSGDLFGSLTDKDADGLYADENDWAGMRAFHQIYMPSNRALRHAIGQIRRLAPDVAIIAPQHGRILRGGFVKHYMRRLDELPVGLDIIDDRNASPETVQAWTTVLQRVLDAAMGAIPDASRVVLGDPDLRHWIEPAGQGVRITQMGRSVVERAVRVLAERLPTSYSDMVRYEAATAAAELDLPTPNIELDGNDDDAGDRPRPARRTGEFAFARLDGGE